MGESSEEIILTNDSIKKEREQSMTTNTDLEGIADEATRQIYVDVIGKGDIVYGVTNAVKTIILKALQSIQPNDKLVEEIRRKQAQLASIQSSMLGHDSNVSLKAKIHLLNELLQFQEGVK